MWPSPTPRRTFLGRLLSLPLFGISPAALAKQVDTASTAIRAQIEDAERRCIETREAFASALAAFEAALPPPHPSLDGTKKCLSVSVVTETRMVDNKPPLRATLMGRPSFRFVATVETISAALRRSSYLPRYRRKQLRRMLFRAALRQREVKALEECYDLEKHYQARSEASVRLNELGQAIFAQPASSMGAALTQARMITAYDRSINEQHRFDWQLGSYGRQLAATLQDIAA